MKTITSPILNRQNGISVDLQRTERGLLTNAMYPTLVPFILPPKVDGGPAGTVQLSTRAAASGALLPLPSNSLVGCGG